MELVLNQRSFDLAYLRVPNSSCFPWNIERQFIAIAWATTNW